jgi:hypothetical protein
MEGAMAENRRQKITFIETDLSPDEVRRSLPRKQLVEVDLFVRKPDREQTEDFASAARLCGCRRICLAFIEPDA